MEEITPTTHLLPFLRQRFSTSYRSMKAEVGTTEPLYLQFEISSRPTLVVNDSIICYAKEHITKVTAQQSILYEVNRREPYKRKKIQGN
ncbi:hypothetical protein V6N13_010915 [Hibiscus sabdariffa]|uniref:Uncharacterized protein n=1 Tax=Hibiscus sabdariffa TaxID=183260 RepID=A0ABR2SAV4_9ROSI